MNFRGQVFVDLLIGFDDDRAFDRVDDIFERRAADNAVAQALDFLAAFDDGRRRDSLQRAAVLFTDDYVLGHVNQPTG